MADASLVMAAEELLAAAKSFDGDGLSRMKLTKQIDNISYQAEDGFGTIMRRWDQVHLTTALDVLTRFNVLQSISHDASLSSLQLAEAAGLGETVIRTTAYSFLSAMSDDEERCMRVVCAQGNAEEVSPDTYRHNAKSLVYVTGPSRYFFKCLLDQDFAFKRLGSYLASHSPEDLLDRTKSPYAFAHNMEGHTYYQVISSDPERFEMFKQTLVQMDAEMPVLGMYPFQMMQDQVEAEPERPFIVDVGGGMGKDRPDVLASIQDDSIPGVVGMEHDFFTPQPVKNAHLYLLRRILHDFYGEPCIEIVRNIASAMGPSSRLLIGDFVVPDRVKAGDDFMIYWMYLSMMILTGKEKTRREFEELLDAAGLEMVKVWPVGAQCIAEAKLKV